jgi:hypothetical protein
LGGINNERQIHQSRAKTKQAGQPMKGKQRGVGSVVVETAEVECFELFY